MKKISQDKLKLTCVMFMLAGGMDKPWNTTIVPSKDRGIKIGTIIWSQKNQIPFVLIEIPSMKGIWVDC